MEIHHQFNSTRLLAKFFLLSIFLLAKFLDDPMSPNEDCSPPPLAAIVEVSSEHLRRSLELGENLLELSRTFGFADYRREYDLVTLESRIRPYNKNVSNSLYATYQTLSEVRPHMRYPLSFVAADLGGTLARICDLTSQVQRFHNDPEAIRDPWALVALKGQVTRVFSRVIPSDLTKLERFLTLSSEHCEILEHMGATVVPILPTLLEPLGLVRPRFVIAAWTWERNPAIQESIRLHESIEALFKEVKAHCKVLSGAEHTFRDYLESQDLFRTYGYLSQNPLNNTFPVDKLLDKITDLIANLEKLVDTAAEERRRILNSLELPYVTDHLQTSADV